MFGNNPKMEFIIKREEFIAQENSVLTGYESIKQPSVQSAFAERMTLRAFQFSPQLATPTTCPDCPGLGDSSFRGGTQR